MSRLDAAVTHAINALAGTSLAFDFLMIWISGIGILLIVLAVASQWWRRIDRPRIPHVIVAAILVAVSRIYIGTHFVSDVLGGAMTGVAAAILARAFYWQGTRADRLITGIL